MPSNGGRYNRALLIGNTYSQNYGLRLFGPENDVPAMKACLLQFRGTPYEVRVRMDQSAEEMVQSIDSFFGEAKPEDVSLLYHSGHGTHTDDQQAALLGNDGESCLSVTELRSALNSIPGRKIVVIDACYSGSFITDNGLKSDAAPTAGESAEPAGRARDFADDFVNAFRVRSSGLSTSAYFVLTAASEDEESYELQMDGGYMGLFTASLVEGCGWDAAAQAGKGMSADDNENSVVTLQEIYCYTRDEMLAFEQHVRVSPEDCGWFGMLRKE